MIMTARSSFLLAVFSQSPTLAGEAQAACVGLPLSYSDYGASSRLYVPTPLSGSSSFRLPYSSVTHLAYSPCSESVKASQVQVLLRKSAFLVLLLRWLLHSRIRVCISS